MSEAAWIAVCNLAATCFIGWLQYLLARKVEQVHHATNSMKDALVASTATASHAQGMQDQREINGGKQ